MPHQPGSSGRPKNSRSRQVLIVLAVVLALLVLLCAGVISFLAQQNSAALAPAGVVHSGVVGDPESAASYRLIKQVALIGGVTPANEGRQTL